METRANYLLIGAFTLAGFLGLLGFFLWFARVELDRQFAYYDVMFNSVAGLSDSAAVRFSGLPVGQVVDVRLDPELSGQVLVRVEVEADTPVRTSSVATIESLGVTGVSYVSISSGDSEDPLLAAVSDDPIPVVPSRPSALQSVTEGAPEILDEVLQISRSVSDILGPENQQRVTAILANIESSSANLQGALDDISAVTETLATATGDIGRFTAQLEDISSAATDTLRTADATLTEVRGLAERARTTLDTGDATLESGRRALDAANVLLSDELPAVVDDLDRTLVTLRTQIDRVGGDASEVLAEFRQTGSVATDRLRQAEAVVASADRVLSKAAGAVESVDAAARDLDALITGEGTALVGDARAFLSDANALVASARAVAETDLPAILADVRAATATAAGVVERVGQDLSSAADRVDAISAQAGETLGTVTRSFETANGTLARLNAALETGEAALSAAESAFTSADRVLDEDVERMVATLETTLAGLDAAVAAVAEDVPAITEELRQTAAHANAAFAQVQSAAGAVAPALRTFGDEGLPQYSRLAREARELVGNLQQLVRQIQRDPARYFLGREEPAFRR